MTIEKRYRCDFCGKTFQREVWYKKHQCEKRARFNQAHDMDVIFGHKLFNHWSRRQGFLRHGQARTFKEFVTSPYYKTFMRLVEFSKKTYLISAFQYLDWIIFAGLPEREWFLEKSVENYRRYIRRTDDPAVQTDTTCENARKWCETHKVPVSEFFGQLTPGDAIKWLKLNMLSPWVLFGYDKAVADLLARFDEEKLLVLDEYINTAYWMEKVEERKTDVAIVQEKCQRFFDGR